MAKRQLFTAEQVKEIEKHLIEFINTLPPPTDNSKNPRRSAGKLKSDAKKEKCLEEKRNGEKEDGQH
ncbi:hypothetical protein [Ralstonia pseudosolanacearum]|uniref:hypothetical protein n=1 Tax=Ralstonia pseudosolanacearum TaxID=1310165 RepID=UPI0033908A69